MPASDEYVIAKKRVQDPADIAPPTHPDVLASRNNDVWNLLYVFRFLNALLVWTFFQPDEYFQSLEPAWQIAFGTQSGAWITWEWQHQLRSSLHPALFAFFYYGANQILSIMATFPQFKATLLSILPNIVQGVIAALGDYYTWKLSERVYGVESDSAWATLLMTTFSPWQWFCSTRTFSNSLETTLTIAALYYWPWEIMSDTRADLQDTTSSISSRQSKTITKAQPISVFRSQASVGSLRIALLLASTASILRPTNLLIWFCLIMPIVANYFSATSRAAPADYLVLIRESILCGMTILTISAVSDRLYFGVWTFPPYQWLTFNISQDLAVFYGSNDWHYYVSQGLPQLLTTFSPFAISGLMEAMSQSSSTIRFTLVTTILVTLATLSLIAHKEVRFIYPLLPLLHVLTAPKISDFFLTCSTSSSAPNEPIASGVAPQTRKYKNKIVLSMIVTINIILGAYATFFHQRGVISVLPYLRQTYELQYLTPQGQPLPMIDNHTFAAFLMPCHSTPWRSKLYHPSLTAWALTCEPPIRIPAHSPERLAYRSENDRFFDDIPLFLAEELGTGERPWPRYVVGFDNSDLRGHLERAWREEARQEVGEDWGILERWRGFNSHWHDDSRRVGDVVVWELVGPVYDVERLVVEEVVFVDEEVLA